ARAASDTTTVSLPKTRRSFSAKKSSSCRVTFISFVATPVTGRYNYKDMINLGPEFLYLAGFFLIVLPLQLYLFRQLQSYIKEQVKEVELIRKLLFALGCLFVVMQLLALWRGLFGLNIGDPYSQLVRGFFTAASIWAVGSIGAAAIFLVYNLFQRF